MFTGLIEGLGRVESLTRRGPDAVLRVRAEFDLAGTKLGDSVAVSGPCLTVTWLEGRSFQMDVSAETLSQTTLGRLKPGAPVNLERALRLGDRLGGHLVSGHVDGQGALVGRESVGSSLRLRYRLPAEPLRYVIPKGSIAVDGVSLTVNAVGPDFFEVNLIPHTTGQTTLGLNNLGEMVNIETDLIGKYVERLLGPHASRSGLSREFLAQAGFLDE
jgi:riboflavin synthase